MTNYIYKYTNKINGKCYVGETCKPESRYKQHKNQREESLFHKAIKKYGFENFTYEIIDQTEDESKVHELEAFHIRKNNSLAPNGYNLVIFEEGKWQRSEIAKKNYAKSGQRYKRKNVNRKGVGVDLLKSGKWITIIRSEGKTHSKTFNSYDEAAMAYDLTSLYLYGQDCQLNFPEKLSEYLKADLREHYDNFLLNNKQKKKSSKYYGVSFNRQIQKFTLKLKHPALKPYAYFVSENEKEVAEEVDKFLIFIGSDHPLNFPEKRLEYSQSDLTKYFTTRLKQPQSSSYTRIHYHKKDKCYYVTFRVDGKPKAIPRRFGSEEEAVEAHDKWILLHNLDHNLHRPDKKDQYLQPIEHSI